MPLVNLCQLGPSNQPDYRMGYDVAKLLLEKAQTPLDRQKAVRVAVRLGMPLHEIEAYLDWLDLVRERQKETNNGNSRPESDANR